MLHNNRRGNILFSSERRVSCDSAETHSKYDDIFSNYKITKGYWIVVSQI